MGQFKACDILMFAPDYRRELGRRTGERIADVERDIKAWQTETLPLLERVNGCADD